MTSAESMVRKVAHDWNGNTCGAPLYSSGHTVWCDGFVEALRAHAEEAGKAEREKTLDEAIAVATVWANSVTVNVLQARKTPTVVVNKGRDGNGGGKTS